MPIVKLLYTMIILFYSNFGRFVEGVYCKPERCAMLVYLTANTYSRHTLGSWEPLAQVSHLPTV